jgi:hypothetical protein
MIPRDSDAIVQEAQHHALASTVRAALVAMGLLSLITPGLTWGQQMLVYPRRGQSPNHVPNKMVAAIPGGKQTAIKSVARLDGRLILQGSENGRSWTATIAEDSGKIAIAVVDQDHMFAIFGACITP